MNVCRPVSSHMVGVGKLDLVGVQGVRWDKGGTEPADDCTFFDGKGNATYHTEGRLLHSW
jgi:hypothetical protein